MNASDPAMWMKIAALIMRKLDLTEVLIDADTVEEFADGDLSILAEVEEEVLRVRLLPGAEAAAYAASKGALDQ